MTLVASNEADIIATNIFHHMELVDEMWVMDNGSVDGTYEILQDLVSRFGEDRLHLFRDDEPIHDQQKRVNYLIQQGRETCDWWLHVDADEFYVGSIRQTLEKIQARGCNVVVTHHWDFLMTGFDNLREWNPVMRLTWRKKKPNLNYGKVIHRDVAGASVFHGNHSVSLPDEEKIFDIGERQEIRLFHYPHRDWLQYRMKYIRGGQAFENDVEGKIPAQVGSEWRKKYAEYKKNGDVALHELFQTCLRRDRSDLESGRYECDGELAKALEKHSMDIKRVTAPYSQLNEPRYHKMRLGRKILVVIDEYGWAFEFFARGLQKYSKHQVKFVAVESVKKTDLEQAELIFAMNKVVHDCMCVKPDLSKTICGIRSGGDHIELAKFVALVAVSKEMYEKAKRENPNADNIYYVRNAVDGSIFTPQPLKGSAAGWAGSNVKKKRKYLLKQLTPPVNVLSEWGKQYFVPGTTRQKSLDFYRSLMCYVQLTLGEGMSQATLEAAACGLPIIATTSGDTSLLVDNEWTVDVNAHEEKVVEFANEKLALLRSDMELAQRVGRRNRQRFTTGGWSWDRRVQEYDVLFDKLFDELDKRDGVFTSPDLSGIEVSVVIPCYKQGHLVHRAIESVLAQTYKNWELIVVNDGSPDNCSEVVRRYQQEHGEDKIRLVEQENQGLANARNTGFSMAKGACVIPLDADNMLKPEMMVTFKKVLDTHPTVGVVFSDMQLMSGGIFKQFYDPKAFRTRNHIDALVMMRKSVWKACGGYVEMGGLEDWDLWFSCIEHNVEFFKVKEPLLVYDDTSGNALTKNLLANWDELYKRVRARHPVAFGDEKG
jgi:glycosyltransferase involved in cell wall biosynthesis